MSRLKQFILFAMVLACTVVHAQPGTIDSTFNPTDLGFGFGNGANNIVNVSVIQPDGKVLIGGTFTSYGGFARNRIARLNADGSLDTSFVVGTGADSPVNAIAVLTDGKILIGGTFSSYNGTGRNRIARLNPDGSIDASFNPGSGVFGGVNTLLVLPDGKILIGGEFTSYNGTPINRIARLNSDGSLDMSFNPGTGANNIVLAIALQADGKCIIGGSFTAYDGISRIRIARINTDGSLDTGFTPGAGTNGDVRSLAVQADERILLGGGFSTYNGSSRTGIARVNTDGSLDASFNTILNFSDFRSLALQADEKIVIGGGFAQVNNTPRLRVARLNTDGSLDMSFDPGEGLNNTLLGFALQPDEKIVMVGWFTYYDGTPRSRVVRALPDGSIDPDFNKATGANSNVFCTLLQPDGKILISGDLLSYNDTARARIARLNADGSLDNSFNPGTGANSTIAAMALQPDGKIVIGGLFTNFDGVTRNRIARLNADGSLDLSFIPGNPGNGFTSPSTVISAVLVQPDGKIVVAGNFTNFNSSITRMRILRLNADGSLDTGFAPTGVGTNGPINAAAFQSDGKILIGGAFNLFGPDTQWRVARLNTDGSLDPSFNSGTGPNQTVNALAVQEDDKILIGGRFVSYNGTTRRRIARINNDGSLDASFNPGGGVEPSSPVAGSIEVNTIAVRPDGIILLGGLFTEFDGTPRNRIAQLMPDGSLDMDFDPGTGANGSVRSLSVQLNGQNIIGGTFTSYDGTGRNRITRVNGNPICILEITDVSVTDEVCPGAEDGIIQATATCTSCENGSADIRFSLDSINFNNTTGEFTNLPPGSYTVYIIDVNNPVCVSSDGPHIIDAGSDSEGPTIECPDNVIVQADSGECSASNVLLGTPTVTDNCNATIVPTNNAPLIFPFGSTQVIWTADDGNDNVSTCTMTVTVQDMEPPSITCPANVTVIADTGECTASNVNLGTPVVGDNCTGSITATNDAPMNFPLGFTTVTWTAEDDYENTASCIMTVLVEINGAPCDFPLTGTITWEHNDSGVLAVDVVLTGDLFNNTLTDAGGQYEFLVPPGSYVLNPSKTDDLLNGVSVLDVMMVQEHVTLVNPITDPYKLIAADVNESDGVSTLDALIIAQSILGNPIAVALFGDSWRFVDAEHSFVTPLSPWGFPESIDVPNLEEEVFGLNFIGVKKGDINGSAAPNIWSEEPADRNNLPALVMLQTPDRELRTAGEEIEVIFYANSFKEITAYQFGLEYHAGYLELLEIIPGAVPELTTENFRADDLAGALRSLWFSTSFSSTSLASDAPVFTLRFKVQRSTFQPLSELLWLSDEVLQREAYNETREAGVVTLEFLGLPLSSVEVSDTNEFRLYQNTPNPFDEQTRISFSLPEATTARLRIFSTGGQELHSSESFYPAGYNELHINNLPASGLLYYHLDTPTHSAIRKMVKH
jgi:uncharacterized delta-60 repeat protein